MVKAATIAFSIILASQLSQSSSNTGVPSIQKSRIRLQPPIVISCPIKHSHSGDCNIVFFNALVNGCDNTEDNILLGVSGIIIIRDSGTDPLVKSCLRARPPIVHKLLSHIGSSLVTI